MNVKDWILNPQTGPAKPKKYRKAVMVMNGKHTPTYAFIESDEPPSAKDLKVKSAHNRQGMPTGC